MALPEVAETTQTAPPERRRPNRRAMLALVPVAALGVAGASIGVNRMLYPPETPATPLGAVATLEGGLGLIHGIIPLESSTWVPPTPAPGLAAPIAEGCHRVRLLLELTAVAPEGLDFAAADYSVQEVAGFSFTAGPLWTSHESSHVPRGSTLAAAMVFEIPNKSLRLVLQGPGSVRLGMGTDHHTS
jgi:hypothetical protein